MIIKKMDYMQIGIVIVVIVIFAVVGYFVFVKKPAPPTPPPCLNPPCPPPPPQNPSWPMEKEVFFVKLDNNSQVNISNWVNTDQAFTLSVADLIRMYNGYSIPNLNAVTTQIQNGLSFNNNNQFYLYQTLASTLRSGGRTPINYNGMIQVNGTQFKYVGPTSIPVPVPSNQTFGEVIYPVYGYKPAEQYSDAKQSLFSRTSGNESATYMNQGGNEVAIAYSWNMGGTQATILPFNAQNWGYYGPSNIVKTSSNMTEGKELFIVTMSSPVTAQTSLNSGYSIGTLDQFSYSASQGANNFIYAGLVDNTIKMITGRHGNNANPNSTGLSQQICSYTPSTCQSPQFTNLNKNGYASYWSPTLCPSNPNYIHEIPNFSNPTWNASDNVTFGACGDNMHLFVWGVKPIQGGNVKIVSSGVVSIEPFMITQSGSKWSMYN